MRYHLFLRRLSFFSVPLVSLLEAAWQLFHTFFAGRRSQNFTSGSPVGYRYGWTEKIN